MLKKLLSWFMKPQKIKIEKDNFEIKSLYVSKL